MNKIDEVRKALEEKKNDSTLKRYARIGEKEPYIGCTMGDIKKVSTQFKNDSDHFMDLFRSGILDIQILAVYIVKPQKLTEEEILECISVDSSVPVIDKFSTFVLFKRKDLKRIKDEMKDYTDTAEGRYYWNCVTELIRRKEYSSKDLRPVLDSIISEMKDAHETTKWAMNHAFVEIALSYPEYREEVLKVSPELGVYKDMVVSKGCTSPYAPEWIYAILKKQ